MMVMGIGLAGEAAEEGVGIVMVAVVGMMVLVVVFCWVWRLRQFVGIRS